MQSRNYGSWHGDDHFWRVATCMRWTIGKDLCKVKFSKTRAQTYEVPQAKSDLWSCHIQGYGHIWQVACAEYLERNLLLIHLSMNLLDFLLLTGSY